MSNNQFLTKNDESQSLYEAIEGQSAKPFNLILNQRYSKNYLKRIQLLIPSELNSLVTQEDILIKELCNSPKIKLSQELNDNEEDSIILPEEPTKEYNISLLLDYGLKLQRRQLMRQSIQLGFFNGIHVQSQRSSDFFDKRVSIAFKPSLDYYFKQLLEANDIQEKNQTELQKIICLHFQQTIFQIQQSDQFQPPPIQTLKNRIINLQPRRQQNIKKTLILDLDETLVHCNENLAMKADFFLSIVISFGFNIKAGVRVRPYLMEFLTKMSQYFEIIVFTASHRIYAEAVLNKIDDRESCIQDRGCYIKDLRIINGRDMSEIIIVDNSTMSFIYQLENGIPIIPFYSNEDDKELITLGDFLMTLKDVPDVRNYLKDYFKFSQLLKITDNNLAIKIYQQ